MWHCVLSGGVIACQSARNCFKYHNLWYTVRFAWCYGEKISKFNVFHFLPASAFSLSDNFSSPHGDSRWGHGKWLEVTVPQVMLIFDWEIPPGFTPAIWLSRSFVNISALENQGGKCVGQTFQNIVLDSHADFWVKLFVIGLDCTASKTKAKLDPRANLPRWCPPTCTRTLGGKHTIELWFII